MLARSSGTKPSLQQLHVRKQRPRGSHPPSSPRVQDSPELGRTSRPGMRGPHNNARSAAAPKKQPMARAGAVRNAAPRGQREVPHFGPPRPAPPPPQGAGGAPHPRSRRLQAVISVKIRRKRSRVQFSAPRLGVDLPSTRVGVGEEKKKMQWSIQYLLYSSSYHSQTF